MTPTLTTWLTTLEGLIDRVVETPLYQQYGRWRLLSGTSMPAANVDYLTQTDPRSLRALCTAIRENETRTRQQRCCGTCRSWRRLDAPQSIYGERIPNLPIGVCSRGIDYRVVGTPIMRETSTPAHFRCLFYQSSREGVSQ